MDAADQQLPAVPAIGGRGLAVFAALNALSVWGGAVGPASGVIGFGDTEMVARLPSESPGFGAVALTCVVAVPCSVLSWRAWRGSHRTSVTEAGVGLLLVGRIAVALAFIRELSWFQLADAAFGAGLIADAVRRHRVPAAVTTELSLGPVPLDEYARARTKEAAR